MSLTSDIAALSELCLSLWPAALQSDRVYMLVTAVSLASFKVTSQLIFCEMVPRYIYAWH